MTNEIEKTEEAKTVDLDVNVVTQLAGDAIRVYGESKTKKLISADTFRVLL